MFELTVVEEFSAAHRLPGTGGKCEALHGHNWKVTAFVECEHLDALGLGIDFRVLRRHLRAVLADLDHRDLNETSWFRETNPSAEHLARHVFERLAERLAGGPAAVVRVLVQEGDDSGAAYRP
jgi:6-pyruvoyltetrahydropterin/6-carboxytetrahydropterin synthase